MARAGSQSPASRAFCVATGGSRGRGARRFVIDLPPRRRATPPRATNLRGMHNGGPDRSTDIARVKPATRHSVSSRRIRGSICTNDMAMPLTRRASHPVERRAARRIPGPIQRGAPGGVSPVHAILSRPRGRRGWPEPARHDEEPAASGRIPNDPRNAFRNATDDQLMSPSNPPTRHACTSG